MRPGLQLRLTPQRAMSSPAGGKGGGYTCPPTSSTTPRSSSAATSGRLLSTSTTSSTCRSRSGARNTPDSTRLSPTTPARRSTSAVTSTACWRPHRRHPLPAAVRTESRLRLAGAGRELLAAEQALGVTEYDMCNSYEIASSSEPVRSRLARRSRRCATPSSGQCDEGGRDELVNPANCRRRPSTSRPPPRWGVAAGLLLDPCHRHLRPFAELIARRLRRPPPRSARPARRSASSTSRTTAFPRR